MDKSPVLRTYSESGTRRSWHRRIVVRCRHLPLSRECHCRAGPETLFKDGLRHRCRRGRSDCFLGKTDRSRRTVGHYCTGGWLARSTLHSYNGDPDLRLASAATSVKSSPVHVASALSWAATPHPWFWSNGWHEKRLP